MLQLLGEFECKIDAKGRMRLPSSLIRQLGTDGSQTFVINRGLEKHLVIYPKKVWDVMVQKVNALNPYVKKNREFIRYFFRGATEVIIDGSDRILLTKRLLEYAGIEKDAILFAVNDKIEIWSKAKYDNSLDQEPENFSDLAEEVMGDSKPDIDLD